MHAHLNRKNPEHLQAAASWYAAQGGKYLQSFDSQDMQPTAGKLLDFALPGTPLAFLSSLIALQACPGLLGFRGPRYILPRMHARTHRETRDRAQVRARK